MACVRQWPCAQQRTGRAHAIGLGQLISLLVGGTGIFSQFLSRHHVDAPATQSVLNYVLLTLHLVYLLWKRKGCWKLRVAWWRYALLSIADVEANYFVVLAYQYTSITSVMLIDCFTIPCVMLLSRCFLHVKYGKRHYIGVTLCLAGLGGLVASDVLYQPERHHTGGRNPLVGDLLCMLGSTFYAISNVGQEAVVKQFDRVEFLGMLGAGGCVVSAIQLLLLERHEIVSLGTHWNNWLLILGFALCLFGMYTLTSLFLTRHDAAMFNLSLLTSDIWGVLAGVILFGQDLGVLYFLAAATIVAGLIVYNQDHLEGGPPPADSVLGHSHGAFKPMAEQGSSPTSGHAESPKPHHDPEAPREHVDTDTPPPSASSSPLPPPPPALGPASAASAHAVVTDTQRLLSNASSCSSDSARRRTISGDDA